MSNFSSLKNVPPVFQNLTSEKVLKKLREPLSIAVLASLGVHGLLWFGLPLISSSKSKPPEQRSLNVVELSPLEQQARLPQGSLFDPFATKKANPKTSSSTKTEVPLVPIDPNIASVNPFYQIPDTSSSSSFDTGSTTTKQEPSKSTTTKKKQEPKQSEAETTETEAEGNSDQSSTSSDDLMGADGKPLSKSQVDQDKLALQQSFAFNATGTSEQDFANNSAIAASQISDKFNIRDWEKPVNARAPYPKDACQFQHDGKPVKGVTGLVVVMQPDGSLSDTALMVKSSGFKGLDEAARQFVEKQWSDIAKQNKLETSSKPKAFPLAIMLEPTEADCTANQKPVS
ncbi:MAG: hypothetical protein NW224_21875 [Leptolyngbyaceae cyanobacterium bins.302]|nr:hypothetical protein [Leptolyngbyaceae cyanobacterium bins.302]